MHLRIPAWCRKATLKVNGEAVDLDDVTSDGYAAIEREWHQGDRLRLDLDMSIDRLFANPKVRQDVGRVALSRGPLIYCVEATDNASQLHRIALPRTASIEAHDEPNLLGGVVTLSATAQHGGRRRLGERALPYRSAGRGRDDDSPPFPISPGTIASPARCWSG